VATFIAIGIREETSVLRRRRLCV